MNYLTRPDFETWFADPDNHTGYEVTDPTPDEDGDITVLQWYGPGSDCETCGWNGEEVTVYFCARTSKWTLQGSWGCYSGAFEEYDTKDEALRHAKAEIHWMENPPGA
ncbi:hypothetical protein [Aeromicrobium sp. 179-A 4D2 NHS]|uniref:hypothetical protein n=1 Tax=Aeromicrobium sp. 179-A 4D2 NHS TaxID=3142375 RepID=UPI0039A3E735